MNCKYIIVKHIRFKCHNEIDWKTLEFTSFSNKPKIARIMNRSHESSLENRLGWWFIEIGATYGRWPSILSTKLDLQNLSGKSQLNHRFRTCEHNDEFVRKIISNNNDFPAARNQINGNDKNLRIYFIINTKFDIIFPLLRKINMERIIIFVFVQFISFNIFYYLQIMRAE